MEKRIAERRALQEEAKRISDGLNTSFTLEDVDEDSMKLLATATAVGDRELKESCHSFVMVDRSLVFANALDDIKNILHQSIVLAVQKRGEDAYL